MPKRARKFALVGTMVSRSNPPWSGRASRQVSSPAGTSYFVSAKIIHEVRRRKLQTLSSKLVRDAWVHAF